MKKVELLQLPNGKVPFKEWVFSLPLKAQTKIFDFIKRAADGGSKKNIKALGNGIFELKIDYQAGYRVYFGELNNVIILILLGGDKSTQKRDIKKAKEYWSTINV